MKTTTNSTNSTEQNLSATLETIISKTKAKRQGDGWQGCCPAHNDKTPSLSIHEGTDGRVLLKCHTGCGVENVVSALNLEMADLFPEKETKPRYEIEQVYDYCDERGELLFQAVRKKLANPDECPSAK